MLWHRTAQRLQGLLPTLQGQNKLQQNNSQELSLTDFEGSRFDRWLRQGSGQHPLTGSPQHQWGFLVSGKPGNRLTACCSGALAVLCGCGPVRLSCPGHHYHQGGSFGTAVTFWLSLCLASSKNVYSCKPFSLHHYFQNMNQGGLCSAGAGGSALASWLIWPSRNLIRSLALARSVLSCSTSSLLVARAGGSSSGMSINHLLPTMIPVITPLANLRLMVLGETARAIAASCIESCMTPMVNHRGYPEPRLLVKPSPSLPRLGKHGSMASVEALRPGVGQLEALRPGVGQLEALRPGADCGQVGGAE